MVLGGGVNGVGGKKPARWSPRKAVSNSSEELLSEKTLDELERRFMNEEVIVRLIMQCSTWSSKTLDEVDLIVILHIGQWNVSADEKDDVGEIGSASLGM